MASGMFYASLESSDGDWDCSTNGTDGVWGCGCDGPNDRKSCGPFNMALGGGNWGGWAGYSSGGNELSDMYKPYNASGGVMCCFEPTPTCVLASLL